MVSGEGELALYVKRAAFDLFIDLKQRKREQLFHQLGVVAGAACGVAGLQEERQTGRNAALLESVGDLLGSVLRNGRMTQPGPRRVVQQKLGGHSRAQP